MKIKHLFVLILMLFLFIGCKKSPFDYRTKYLGDYRFTIHKLAWYAGNTHIDTIYYYEGRIDYGNDDNTIAIYWRHENFADYPNLFEDASIGNYGCHGDFLSSTKVQFSSGYASSSSQLTYYVTGEKKK
jgi:hypothetical protein